MIILCYYCNLLDLKILKELVNEGVKYKELSWCLEGEKK